MVVLTCGCAQIPEVADPVATAKPAPRPAPAPKPEKAPDAAPTPPRVAIVLSDGKPAYADVATEVGKLLDDHSIYNLADPGLSAEVAMDIIAETDVDVVVAIGLRAAIAAKAGSEFPVVFSQVFNYSDHQLISKQFKGVASIPPLDQQIEAWKRLNPNLKNIAAIVGDGHDYLIEQAVKATEQHDVRLHHRTARSDRETFYLFNQLLPHIDGFWLFPDNRVLSPAVLRQMLESAARQDVQVSVFSDSLLGLGAALSATSEASDIATRIVSVVEQFVEGSDSPIPDITPLTRVTITTSDSATPKVGMTTANSTSTSSREHQP
ncbi:MAG: hypothetical protein OES38_15395 [Gammaproteobacteria bacterium]|nr:hypothetical protein [Gammaproteobacteria bacterium]